MRKVTKCKRCDAENVYWTQSGTGKWVLYNQKGNPHYCEDGKIKAVKCKYCTSADLHWAEEINPQTQEKKMILTESYGLPHACDERLAILTKEKRDKQDKYEAEKKRVATHPEGLCTECKGTGFNNGLQPGSYGICQTCQGLCRFDERNRKRMLATTRRKLWPNMTEKYTHYHR